MKLEGRVLARGDTVHATEAGSSSLGVPEGARGVVVDVYAKCAVVAFRWGPPGRLLRPRASDLDGEYMGEVIARDIRRPVETQD